MTNHRIILSLLVCALLSGCSRSKPVVTKPVVEEASVDELSVESTDAQETESGEVEADPDGATGAGTDDAAAAQGLDKNVIRQHIRSVLPSIEDCYEQELLNDPTLEGRVVVNFLIAPSGVVEEASAEGINEKVASCVADVVKAIQFPKTTNEGYVQVSYPFTFKPTEE